MKTSTAIRRFATVLASGLTLAIACAAAQPEAAQTTDATEAWPDPDHDIESIEGLRRSAAVGNAVAALLIATRLVDRFERGGPSDDLDRPLPRRRKFRHLGADRAASATGLRSESAALSLDLRNR